jgi:hypothetical protein
VLEEKPYTVRTVATTTSDMKSWELNGKEMKMSVKKI